MNAEAIIPRFLLRHPCAPKSRTTSLPAVIEVLRKIAISTIKLYTYGMSLE